MTRSAHPAVARVPQAEYGSLGWCTVEVAQAEFGLSRSKLFELMKAGVLPWYRPEKSRLISRRALVALCQAEYEADPEPVREFQPGAGVRTN